MKERSRWRKKISAPQTSTGGQLGIDVLVIRLTSKTFTVAGQRRIFTDFPKHIDYLVVGEINHHSTTQASRRYASNHGI